MAGPGGPGSPDRRRRSPALHAEYGALLRETVEWYDYVAQTTANPQHYEQALQRQPNRLDAVAGVGEQVPLPLGIGTPLRVKGPQPLRTSGTHGLPCVLQFAETVSHVPEAAPEHCVRAGLPQFGENPPGAKGGDEGEPAEYPIFSDLLATLHDE